MSGQTSVNIRTFLPADSAQVLELFASGLMEFAGGVEHQVRSYVDNSLKDDLADIPGSYLSHPRSNFWVADSGGAPALSADAPANMIVGIVGIQPRELEEEGTAADERFALRASAGYRPQTARDHRGFLPREGLPPDLPVYFCREKGYRRICLSTVGILQPALAMYARYGYSTVKTETYGDPPYGPIIVHDLVKELG